MKKDLWFVLLGFFFTVILFTYPSIFHLTDKIIGDGGDNYQFLSFQFLGNREFRLGNFPFGWTNYLRYPMGFDFSQGTDSTLFIITGIMLYVFLDNPVLVYNLSILLLLFGNLILSYIFFKKITGDRISGFFGALIYGMSFYTLARSGGHANLLMTGCFPFVLYAFINFLEKKGEMKSFLLLGTGIILVFSVSLQYLLILSGSLLIFIPFTAIFYPEKTKEFFKIFLSKRTETFITLVSIAIFFLVFHGSRLPAFFSGNLILPTDKSIPVPLINYILPNEYLQITKYAFANYEKPWIEYAVLLGFGETVLFLSFLLSGSVKKRLKIYLTSLFVIFLVISFGDVNFGPVYLPYHYLFQMLPFRGIIEPGRFYTVFYLAMTSAILFYLKRFFKETGKWGIIAVFILIIFERLPVGYYLSETKFDREYFDRIREIDTKAVLDLPTLIDWNGGNIYDLYAVYYGKPIVNGYIHWSGDATYSRAFIKKLAAFNCDAEKQSIITDRSELELSGEKIKNIAREMVGYGIRTVVVHKDLFLENADCKNAGKNITVFLSDRSLDVQKIYENEKKIIYNLRGMK